MIAEEVELLSELTIVIQTYNRWSELEQMIEYLRDIPVTVHIIDGSNRPCFPIGQLSGTSSIIYHHVPNTNDEDPLAQWTKRLVFGASLPKTKFSVVGTDDDFLTISGLIAAIKCLNDNNLVDAVTGRVILYRKEFKSISYCFRYPSGTDLIETEGSLIVQRLSMSTCWFLYAVCKTEVWKKFIETTYETRSYSGSQIYASEWMMYILSQTMFQTKNLDQITNLRLDTVSGKNISKGVDWGDWVGDENNIDMFEDLTTQLAKGFNCVTPIAEHAANLEIAQKLFETEKLRFDKNKRKPKLTMQNLFRRSVQKCLPIEVRIWVGKWILAKVLPSEQDYKPRKLKNFIKYISRSSILYDSSELESIENLLLKSREKLRLQASID